MGPNLLPVYTHRPLEQLVASASDVQRTLHVFGESFHFEAVLRPQR